MLLPTRAALVVPALATLALSGCQTADTQRGNAVALQSDEAAPQQQTGGGTFRLDEHGQWIAQDISDQSSDEAILAHAAALIAAGDPGPASHPRERLGIFYSPAGPDIHQQRAVDILNRWIELNAYTDSPHLPRAYLLRGDARLAAGDEYQALYDYETVIKEFPASAEYAKAVERELEIAIRYVHGLKRKFFTMRIAEATDIGEELLVRVQERMPGGDLAERAGIELADYYYRNRDLAAAIDAYEVFLVNHPRSVHANRARMALIAANVGRFKGPSYDASVLTEAQVLIEEYAAVDPVGVLRAGLTDALSARLEESIAAQQLQKVEWFLQRGDPVSARFMLRRLVSAYPRTVAADVALQMLEKRGWTLVDETDLRSPSPEESVQ
jgi:outer membrane protein assembly factor BamD (BamD/ComL family)